MLTKHHNFMKNTLIFCIRNTPWKACSLSVSWAGCKFLNLFFHPIRRFIAQTSGMAKHGNIWCFCISVWIANDREWGYGDSDRPENLFNPALRNGLRTVGRTFVAAGMKGDFAKHHDGHLPVPTGSPILNIAFGIRSLIKMGGILSVSIVGGISSEEDNRH